MRHALRTTTALALLLVGCPKESKQGPGRPDGDVCAGMAQLPDCGEVPQGASEDLDAGLGPAANCYDVGRQQFNCGLFEAAGRSLERSAQLRPDARTFHALGEALLLQEKWQSARDAYTRATQLDAKKRESWLRLGAANTLGKQYADAEQAFRKAIELDPKRPDGYRGAAQALSDQGKFDESMKLLKQAEPVADDKAMPGVLEQEAQVLQLKGRRAEKAHDEDAALDASQQLAVVLKRSTALRPSDANLHRDLADAQLRSGDLEGAEQSFDKVTELDKKDFVSPRMAALLKEKRGDAAGARTSAQASLKVNPKQTLPYLVLGRLDLAASDKEAAAKDYGQALANLDGKDANEIKSTAELAEAVGHPEKAEQLYETLADDPNEGIKLELWLTQARLNQALKHPAKLAKSCAKAKELVPSAVCPPAADKPGK